MVIGCLGNFCDWVWKMQWRFIISIKIFSWELPLKRNYPCLMDRSKLQVVINKLIYLCQEGVDKAVDRQKAIDQNLTALY